VQHTFPTRHEDTVLGLPAGPGPSFGSHVEKRGVGLRPPSGAHHALLPRSQPGPPRPWAAAACFLAYTTWAAGCFSPKYYNRVFRGNLREIKSSSLAAQKTALSTTTGRHPATGPTFPRSLLPSCSRSSLPIGIRSVSAFRGREMRDQVQIK